MNRWRISAFSPDETPRRRRHDALAYPSYIIALDLGLTPRQPLSALDSVALASLTHAQHLADTLERGLGIPAVAAAFGTAAFYWNRAKPVRLPLAIIYPSSLVSTPRLIRFSGLGFSSGHCLPRIV